MCETPLQFYKQKYGFILQKLVTDGIDFHLDLQKLIYIALGAFFSTWFFFHVCSRALLGISLLLAIIILCTVQVVMYLTQPLIKHSVPLNKMKLAAYRARAESEKNQTTQGSI